MVFKICSVNLLFFIEEFNPFPFEVIIDKEECTSAILLLIFCVSYIFLIPHSSITDFFYD